MTSVLPTPVETTERLEAVPEGRGEAPGGPERLGKASSDARGCRPGQADPGARKREKWSAQDPIEWIKAWEEDDPYDRELRVSL